VSNGKLLTALRRRRIAVYVTAAGTLAAVSALTALPSASAATPRIPASATPALRTAMLRLARQSGDANPTAIRAVSTTRAEALRDATPGDMVPGSAGQPAYLVVITGKFKLHDIPLPRGARTPTGRYLAVTVNPATFHVMDLGLSNHKPTEPLRNYGQVSTLIKPTKQNSTKTAP
jgi:hypothetical protein